MPTGLGLKRQKTKKKKGNARNENTVTDMKKDSSVRWHSCGKNQWTRRQGSRNYPNWNRKIKIVVIILVEG